MTTQISAEDKGYIVQAREVFMQISLLAIMSVSCFLLLRPFLKIIISGLIIAIGIYPGHRMLTNFLRGRERLAAVLCTLLLLLVVIVPSVLLAETLMGGIRTIARDLQAGRVSIPPPPSSLEKMPVLSS